MRIAEKNLVLSLTMIFICGFVSGCVSTAAVVRTGDASISEPKLVNYDRPEGYRICPKDMVEIFSPVEKKDEKTMVMANSIAFELIDGQLYSKQKIEVSPLGEIDLVLVGSLKVGSLTLREANDLIMQNMQKYYKHPKIFMRILEYRGYDLKRRIAVMGEVNAPGVYPFQQTTNILEALSFAGGHKNSANLGEVMVIRKGYLAKPIFFKVHASDLLQGKNLADNMDLEGGDVVYVPRSFIGEIGNFIELYVSRIRPVAQAYLDFYYAIHARDTLAKKTI